MVTVPLRLRGAMSATQVTGYVVPDAVLPNGIDILVGKPAIKSMGIKPDSRNMRMELSEVKTAAGIPLGVNTVPLEKQLSILDAPTLRILDIYGGGSFSYQTLRDMGYAIELYDAIEKDGQARVTARCHSDEYVTHLEPHDLMKLNKKLGDTYTDIIATLECAPWSRASGKVVPKGFNDVRANLFEKAAAIISDQRGRNPQLNVLFENTENHPGLPDDAARQERLLKGKFTVSNASDLGGMYSRPRRIHSNMADATQLVTRKPAPSEYALESGWVPVMHPMFCLLSKVDTWNPQSCVASNSLKQVLQGRLTMAQCSENAKHMRTINGNERDCYMGHVPGVTQYKVDEDGNVTEVRDRYRHALLGKGLHEQHGWPYFYHRNHQPLRLAKSMLSQVSTASPEQLELFPSSFSDHE